MTTQFVSNEKEAIQRAMTFIESQMERLQKDYMYLVERSREIDQIETLSKPTESVMVPLPDAKAELTMAEVVAKHNATIGQETAPGFTTVGAYAAKGSSQYISEIEKMKDTEYKNRMVKNDPKKSKYRDMSRIAVDVKNILKDAGRPLKASEIITELGKRGINMEKSPHQVIRNAQGHDSKIERASFGYYQYRG